MSFGEERLVCFSCRAMVYLKTSSCSVENELTPSLLGVRQVGSFVFLRGSQTVPTMNETGFLLSVVYYIQHSQGFQA